MRLAMIGYGTVGQGVADLLRRRGSMYAARAGEELSLVAILVRNADRARAVAPPEGAVVTDEPREFWGIEADVLLEVAGGIEAALGYVTRGLDEGRDVVTANKAMLAAHAPALFAHAEGKRRRIAFEAAVAGGLPLVQTVTTALSSNRIHGITAILNATCNFIVSEMVSEGCGYPAALAAAQRRGYTESDPELDISGRDAADKLALLAALAFGGTVDPGSIPTRGLDDIELEDLHLARSMGHTVKLIAEARRGVEDDGSGVMLRVAPMVLALGHPLAGVDSGRLAAIIEGDAIPYTFMVADSAGAAPTASAVIGDVIGLARMGGVREGVLNSWPVGAGALEVVADAEVRERAYARLHVLHHDSAYETLREHLAGRSIGIDRLHETDHTIALITEAACGSTLRGALADPISAAFDDAARAVLPVLGDDAREAPG